MKNLGKYVGRRTRTLAHLDQVKLSEWVNERPLACGELLSVHDVARITRRSRWLLELMALAGRFPRKARFRGRSVGWLRRDILAWLAGPLALTAPPSDRRDSGLRITAHTSCGRERALRTPCCAVPPRHSRPPLHPIQTGTELRS